MSLKDCSEIRSIMGQVEPAPFATQPEDLISWLPIDACIRDGKPAIEWMDLAGIEFTEPLFQQTLGRVNSDRRRLVTDFDLLLRTGKVFDSLEPSGFIFHSSRCGSTLLANACRALRGSIVISEAPVLDKIASRFLTDADTESKLLLYKLFLKGAVGALGQRRFRNERRFFIKFSCTSTMFMGHIRTIWPNVPFIFLYRDPVEIIVSNLKNIPEWMSIESNANAAAVVAGVGVDQLGQMPAAEFCARALGRFFNEVVEFIDPRTLLVNYTQLNLAGLLSALRFMGVEPSTKEIETIQTMTRWYSKDSQQSYIFQAERDSKRTWASRAAREMADRWAASGFEALENLRYYAGQ